MIISDCLASFIRPSKFTLVLTCLLVTHIAEAKSKPPADIKIVVTPPPALILSLPEKVADAEKQKKWTSTQDNSSLDNVNLLIIGGRKKSPLDVDCGVDVYKNVTPDTPLSRQLTGECDFKYHY